MLTLLFAMAAVDPPATATAWSMSTHAVICEIAWQRLDDRARDFVRTVRQADPGAGAGRLFSESCAWADSVRNTTHRDTYEYHFVNGQRGATAIDWQRDCGAYDCVATAVVRYARYLADQPRSRSDSLRRAEALKFLGHFVGDLHQPLHAGYRDDLGGNLQQARWRGSSRNLHSIWDSALPEHARAVSPDDARRLNAEITPDEVSQWTSTTVFDWVAESWSLTTTELYRFAEGEDLSAGYATRMDSIVVRRIKMAGVRLAHVIELASRGSVRFPPLP